MRNYVIITCAIFSDTLCLTLWTFGRKIFEEVDSPERRGCPSAFSVTVGRLCPTDLERLSSDRGSGINLVGSYCLSESEISSVNARSSQKVIYNKPKSLTSQVK